MSISHRADDRSASAYRTAYARSLEVWPATHRTRNDRESSVLVGALP